MYYIVEIDVFAILKSNTFIVLYSWIVITNEKKKKTENKQHQKKPQKQQQTNIMFGVKINKYICRVIKYYIDCVLDIHYLDINCSSRMTRGHWLTVITEFLAYRSNIEAILML